MPKDVPELLKGTLDLLILKTLEAGPMHGYAIARSIEQATERALQIEEGSLYPALYRMTNRGLLEFEWGRSTGNRRIKSYRLTPNGRKRLKSEQANWCRFTQAVARVLGEQPA
ncbi:MAG: PadR family transcriptional regulator [Gemmatimonadota bacterium]|nr:MAG: PadR family transcriptional regulator [Gemmatimonadota bacterium]